MLDPGNGGRHWDGKSELIKAEIASPLGPVDGGFACVTDRVCQPRNTTQSVVISGD